MKRIAFITDLHLDEGFPIENKVDPKINFDRVLSDLKSRKIEEVVFGGDIGEATAHTYFFEKLEPFSVNVLLGNHDQWERVKTHYGKGEQGEELYYDREDENYQYLYLDSSKDEVSTKQLGWLQMQLGKKKKPIVFIHHPILGLDTPVDKLYPLKNREMVKSLFLQCREEVTLFCGHYHMNDEQVFENIKQYTTQSLSFQLKKKAVGILVDNSSFGYRMIDIYPHKIETHLITFKQEVL